VIVDGVQKARPGSKVNPSMATAGPAEAKADEKAQVKPAERKSAAKAGGK
jgi:hypothetical protein